MPTTTPFANLITFSRGSNATVVGPDGLVQWAPNNLVTYSESFDSTAWFKGNTTVTANAAVAPDGSTTADQIAFAAVANANIQPNPAVTVTAGQVYTFSIYVRASAPVSNVRLSMQGSDTTISVGTAWSRVSMTVTASGGTLAPTLVTRDSVAATIFLWGAQLELGSAATTYNPTTVKNLLGFSEAFDNAAWTKNAASIVTGAAANPVNGLFNAQKLMEGTVNAQYAVFRSVAVAAAPYTFSLYAKLAPGAARFLSLYPQTSGAAWAIFDLSLGTITAVSALNYVSSSITSVGNGWYRCSVTLNASAGTLNCVAYLANTNNNSAPTYTGDGNSGIYIYGAQLSDSASLDPYVPTPGAAPSSTAYYGPRFDYDPATLQPRGILIEEQRTNYQYPSTPASSTGSWNAVNSGAQTTGQPSPDGGNNAVLVTSNGGTESGYRSMLTYSPNTTYTWSVFAKPNGARYAYIRAVCVSGTPSVDGTWFDFQTGQVATKGSGITSASMTLWKDGFYRLSVTATTPASIVNNLWDVRTGDADGAQTSVNGQGMYFFGTQVEAGAFATSYIPTIASTVTRSADVATITGQNFGQFYRQDAGTLVVQGESTTTAWAVALWGSGTNIIRVGKGQADIFTNGSNVFSTSTASTNNFNVGLAYTSGSQAAANNGATMAVGTTTNLPTALTELRFESGVGGRLNGWVRSIRYIPVRAADFQLQALTT